jgi:hypothetical protein
MVDHDEVMDVQDNDQQQPKVINTPAGGNTTFVFKVEQSKVPECFGKKGKDTIS